MELVLFSEMKTLYFVGKKMVTETIAELYSDDLGIRTIDSIIIRDYGRSKEYYFDQRKMELPEGKYLDFRDRKQEVSKNIAEQKLELWRSYPVKDSYKSHCGTTTGKVCYL